MEDEYLNEVHKMALIATSAQLAKEVSVRNDGIGEDLNFNFFGWTGGHLSIICQMGRKGMKQPPADRFQQSFNVCLALRKFWHVTDITLVAEGFISLDPVASKGKDLKKLFTDSRNIKECLTVTHAYLSDRIDDGGDMVQKPVASIIAIPYTYGVGRVVEWKSILASEDNAVKILRESMFPAMMMQVLGSPIEERADDEGRESVVRQMAADGFEVYEFDE